MDAIGSYTLKQGSHTQRDNSDLQDITNPTTKLTSTIESKEQILTHLEVTDRLYNKKQIQKMRMKSGNMKQMVMAKQKRINQLKMEAEIVKNSIPGVAYQDQNIEMLAQNTTHSTSRAAYLKNARTILERNTDKNNRVIVDRSVPSNPTVNRHLKVAQSKEERSNSKITSKKNSVQLPTSRKQ